MPTRLVREGWLDSDPINSLPWEAEVFFLRLILKADDYGRFSGDPRILRPALYPLRLDDVREVTVERLIAECVKARLVRLYSVQGKQFLQVERFKQRIRAQVPSKYPAPDGADDVQMPVTCPADDVRVRSEAEAEAEAEAYAEAGVGGNAGPAPPPVRDSGFTPREAGTNPRATGDNPRATGTNPRALGTNPLAVAKALVGKGPPPTLTRDPLDPDAPRWVRQTAIRDRKGEPIAPATWDAFVAWCRGEDVQDPRAIA